ncbi:hypothetical protein LguiB_015711 [Lonicera macranthoides]
MTTDSDDEKMLREVNQNGGIEHKRIGGGEIERIGDDGGDSRDSRGWAVQGQDGRQVQQHLRHHQPQGSMVRWERFLHVRSIKVLLVENDDSTRHVVTALLRNSNYEVIQAANGLQARKILDDLTNHIDLVLTEVVMPGISGIGLLCKIMSHNVRKNIPVIMMSSHDSMALVFNCLSKGAVDFLVKPIRKNELKNLWQHIWRRCHSSSGSGSESGAKTQKSVKSKTNVKSEEGSSSCEAYDRRRASLFKVGDGSEDGSVTKTSWTKQAVEVDSSPAVCSRDQRAECAYNTCTLVIHSNNGVSGNKWVPMTPSRESQDQDVHDHAAMGKESVSGKWRNFESQSNGPVKARSKPTGTEHNTLPELEVVVNSKRLSTRPAHHSVEYPSNKYEAVITNITDPQMNSKTMCADDSKELMGIELSLKKLRGAEDAGKTVQSDRNVMRFSELSAFSRYNTPSSAPNLPNVITGNSSQPSNTTEIVKKEYDCDVRSRSNRNILQPRSDGISNNIDVGLTTHKLSTNPIVFKSEAVSTSSIQHIHHHHHVHHYHDDFSLKKLAVDSPHCGSSNVLGGPIEGDPENYILNRSASGSKHGSNNQNGSSTTAKGGGTMVERDVLGGKNGGGDAGGSQNMIEQNKSVHREAASTKFCQKRKDRCFQKKVRYQNRKRLAEERLRVQFVRQMGHDSSNSAMDE